MFRTIQLTIKHNVELKTHSLVVEYAYSTTSPLDYLYDLDDKAELDKAEFKPLKLHEVEDKVFEFFITNGINHNELEFASDITQTLNSWKSDDTNRFTFIVRDNVASVFASSLID